MSKVTYVAMMHIFIISMISASEKEVGSARMPKRSIKVPRLMKYASSDDPNASLFQAQVASRDTRANGTDVDIEDTFSNAGASTGPSSFAEPLMSEQQRDHSFSVTVSESSEQGAECSLNFDNVEPTVPPLPTDRTMASVTKLTAEIALLQIKKKPCCCTCVIL